LLELLNVKLAYMPSCKFPEVRLPSDQNVFCVVIVVTKCIMLALVLFSHFVLHRSKIPLVLIQNTAAAMIYKQQLNAASGKCPLVVQASQKSLEVYFNCSASVSGKDLQI